MSDVPMLLDSGADVTLAPSQAVDQLGIAVEPGAVYELVGFDGSRSSARAVLAEMRLLGRIFRGRFLLIDQEYGIIGRDVLNHVSLADEANAKLTSNLLKRARQGSLPPDPSPEGSEIHSMDDIFPQMDAGKFQAPEFVKPHPHASADESLARLKASRERMLANVEQLDGFDLSGLKYPHPFAGELNAYQWILIAGAHEARHAQQINRLKSQSGFPG